VTKPSVGTCCHGSNGHQRAQNLERLVVFEFPAHKCNFGQFEERRPKTNPTIVSAIQFREGERRSQLLEHVALGSIVGTCCLGSICHQRAQNLDAWFCISTISMNHDPNSAPWFHNSRSLEGPFFLAFRQKTHAKCFLNSCICPEVRALN
jgi:hypothetical protein